jgi:hypothetical protein
VLAYVFWHWPAATVEHERYVERLVAFHRAVRAAPPPGFRGSRVLAIEGAPWAGSSHAFEDWYLVDDFAALGGLNEAATTVALQGPHEAIARLAGGGAGGVYRMLSFGRGVPDVARWCSKPAGESYAAFIGRLPAAEAWQRQMVLGPAPEFCILGSASVGVDGITVRVRVIDEQL